MLKILESTESKTQPGEIGVRVGDSKAGHDGNRLNGSEVDNNEVDYGKIGDNEVEKKSWKIFKSKNLSKSKKTGGSDFLIRRAGLASPKLRQAFVKAPIFHHLDPECSIRIETDASVYVIGGVFNPLTLDDLGRWYPVAPFSQKMILVETRYETHDGKLLAIVGAFKT